jgi:N-acetylglucosamine malate deacetylase 1
MKLDFSAERILAVMAHPDDAELLCAGTLARAQADGATIAICVMCNGDKGISAANSAADLTTVRRSEAQSAADLLKAQLFWFNSPDGVLFDTANNRLAAVEIYRQLKPTLVITHAPEDYHPDHRATSAIAEAATWFAASTGHVSASPALASSPSLWFADTIEAINFSPSFYIDVSGQMKIKQQMLACHRSQLARGAEPDFAPLAELMLRQAQFRGRQVGVAAAEAFRQHQAFKRLRAW